MNAKNKKRVTLILAGIIFVIAGGAWYLNFFPSNTIDSLQPMSETAPTKIFTESELTETYTSEKYPFSFRHPKDFKLSFRELVDVDAGKDILLVETSYPRQGFQIEIQPIASDSDVLTAEMIRTDIPDIVIESPQEVTLGMYGKGVAFLSDDPSFEGKTREVWFVYKGILYQIRTYASNDQLMQLLLGTWSFR